MRQFLKFTLASMVGFFLMSLLAFFIFMGIIMASISSFDKKETVTVPDKTILMVSFDQPIAERSSDNPFDNMRLFGGSRAKSLGLNDILLNIKKASEDANVKGMYMEMSDVPSGQATVEEIRNALVDFKKKGKFIVSYGEIFTQKAYYLASVSDKIYLNPVGMFEFKGLSAETMFFKGLLDKLYVQPQIIRHGKFKSAVEPFILDKMSDASKQQSNALVSSIWNHMLANISDSRKIAQDDLNTIANELKVQTPQDAISLKLVDNILYKDQVLDELKGRVNISNAKDLKFMSLNKYANSTTKSNNASDRIAVVYAYGDIVSGNGSNDNIGSERISKAIRQARLDEKVKAIVLRVNSPGGSALASDVIWREMILAKKVKPIVVSMGDVAASGGYYISCAANKIFAYPNTITGSIGVFGIIPNMKEMFNKKLGITFDGVKTNTYADFIPVTRPMTESEKKIMTKGVETTYATFITHVGEGRNMRPESVDSIGQGRVWSGVDAKRIGLIDEFGGINEAIKEAAKLAKLSTYRIKELPERKDAFTQFLEELTGEYATRVAKKEMGAAYPYFKALKRMQTMQGVQAMMPYDIEIK